MPCPPKLVWEPSRSQLKQVASWVRKFKEIKGSYAFSDKEISQGKLSECAFSFFSGLPVNWEIYDSKGDGGVDFQFKRFTIQVKFRARPVYQLLADNSRSNSLGADYGVLITPTEANKGDFWLRGYIKNDTFKKNCEQVDMKWRKDRYGSTLRWGVPNSMLNPINRLLRKIKKNNRICT